ncbi:S-adenosyl-L-methionine-dependent methyltransferase [Ampelomyces quisqualis]|uniref:S-adenosyl-L-methionine-dependent methyltransferase n=1 Tax=Ampelomyces quisqualis TaxID=50730 RepID=A0A6A5QL32_AMPQU|nr:S-adenosyl-L-methionine-dependent methyltransferase [Ampelomyces quisqualis]
MSGGTQVDNAIRFYEAKSRDYDGTWHSNFTKQFISRLDIQKGQRILDLACGTGLLTFLEAEKVGLSGSVVGIDVTPGMLAVATRKQEQDAEKYSNVTFHNGDILHLEETMALQGKTFDVITVASALVLFPDPNAAIEHWSKYLKPGGVLAVDATHPRNLVSGMVLERVARRLDLPMPYNRSWSRSEASLHTVLESAGLEVEKVETIHNQAGYGKRYYDVERWDDFFVENVIVKDVANTFANNEIRRKAQAVYKEEWEKLAIDGKVEEVDAVFLGIARKSADGSRYVPETVSSEAIFKGGCRCGRVQFTSSQRPSDITLCHCRACQQLSGSAYLAFVQIPRFALKYIGSSTLKTMKLSEVAERTFCSSCGTPITMEYLYDADRINITMGSIDTYSMSCRIPKVKKHIFLREKAPWVESPDDSTERWGTAEFAHLVATKN